MKQSAARTLGVAALGAAFAAAGAGVASAAPALPDAPGLDTATQALPTGNIAGILPGAGEALGQGQNALGQVAAVGMPIAHQAVTEGPTKPVSGLLGGLPVGSLPTHGLPVNGIPVG
ncbi:ATP-binding protein [Streptomyces sp. NPDC047022]|uniref:ATP-binding protein n=1 Tax=Streptomyces sp. NPDC047022 TaxID=3155737 RepID=UPI003401C1D1